MSRSASVAVTARAVIGAALLSLAGTAAAQPRGAGAASTSTPRESAPIDLTGTWVAIVNEDWRWRMVTPPKGDVTSIQPLNERGREVANQWDESTDGSCKAYGAAGLMRMPTRLRISWDGDEVLEIETDAGQQTRRLLFDQAAAGGADGPTLQGRSAAQWRRPAPPPQVLGSAPPDRTAGLGGSLHVVTTNLTAGWLRRNGVPYSDQTVLTEYFDRFPAPNGDEWLVVTSIVEDPVYLDGRLITSSHFRRESDDSGWNPRACRADS
jgi:hypothetical protein